MPFCRGAAEIMSDKYFTETALVRIQNDILNTVDQHLEAVFVLLDFSAAFDMLSTQLYFNACVNVMV